LALLPEYTRSPLVTGERMYLDAMQQILSTTSKIVVDAKSGNLLYLPLDKLGATQQSLMKPDATSKSDLMHSSDNSNVLFDGREIIRPTERLGRNG